MMDESSSLFVVGFGEQGLDRYLLEFRIAVEFLSVCKRELRCFYEGVDEFRTRDIEPVELKSLEQCELLQHHGPLRPWSRFADRVAAILIRQRQLDGGLPVRHILSGQHPAIALPAGGHDLLAAAEAIDRLGNKSLRPYFASAFDLLLGAARP